jgi:N-acetyl-gamma-glutamylphosphate reductase
VSRQIKLLIVGGYGTFGGRLVELIENEPRLTLIVAGRSLAKAKAYATARGVVKARLVPASFDRNGDVDAQLATLRPDIVRCERTVSGLWRAALRRR